METTSKALNLQFVEIPSGEFIIGSDLGYDRMSQTDERPRHRLHITQYFIMRYPVTNQQYLACIEATGRRPPQFGWPDGKFPAKKADHLEAGVSFHDAVAFCRWAGEVTGLPLRLPSEPEWEKAARGAEMVKYFRGAIPGKMVAVTAWRQN